jgi:hypothetical protein
MSRLASNKPVRGALITLFPVAVALLACGYDNEYETAPGGVGGGPSVDIQQASIDTGAALTTEPGQGVGALIEYEAGGKWRFHLACDTSLSSERCHWDIVVEPLGGARIRNVTGEQLELDNGEDDFAFDRSGAQLLAITSTDLDSLVVETDPGAGLRVDVLLDGDHGNEFVYWIGGGAMHRGAPTNPVDLTPTEP